MNDKELFEAVLTSLIERYKLVKKNPYNDGYFILWDNDGMRVADLNPEGHNLLYNLFSLTKQLEVAGYLL